MLLKTGLRNLQPAKIHPKKYPGIIIIILNLRKSNSAEHVYMGCPTRVSLEFTKVSKLEVKFKIKCQC